MPDDGHGRSSRFADARCEQARELFASGRVDEARLLLAQVLDRANHLIDLGREEPADALLVQILDVDPDRERVAYLLGRLREAQGNLAGAAEAYRLVIDVEDDVDALARLRRCEADLQPDQGERPHEDEGREDEGADVRDDPVRGGLPVRRPDGGWPVTGPVLRPRLPSQREVLDRGGEVTRGRLRASVRLAVRAQLATASGLKALGFAVAGTVVAWVAQPASAQAYLGLLLIAWLPFLGVLGVAIMRSVMNGADFYDYGVEVKTGLRERTVHFIWYYQLTGSPRYLQRLADHVTRTASLGLTYEESGGSPARHVELRGIGTPGNVRTLRTDVESRILPERIPIRGPFS